VLFHRKTGEPKGSFTSPLMNVKLGGASKRGSTPLPYPSPSPSRGCLVVIARHEVPKQSQKAIVRLLRFACNDSLSCWMYPSKEREIKGVR